MEEEELIDVWRIRNPDLFQFTWKRKHPLCMSQLDYLIIPQAELGLVSHMEIVNSVESDHLFIAVTIDFDVQVKGRGFWKMNNQHLRDKTYLVGINEILGFAEARYDKLNASLKWEMIKIDIIEFSHVAW